MIAALAGVVHDHKCANRHEHDCGEDNYKGVFICDLATAGPPKPPANAGARLDCMSRARHIISYRAGAIHT